MVNDLSFIHTGKEISYTDLPSVDFFSEYEPTKDNKAFLAALRVYKGVDRTDLSSLPSRILLLHFLEKQLDDSNIFTKKIKETIKRKSHHLKELKLLFQKGILRDIPELYNPSIEQLFKSTILGRLHVKNKDVYDYENNVMLGNYILEAVDPAHRFNLTSYADKWKGSCSKIPFFLYLEEHCNYDLIPQVHYLDDKELETKKIEFQNGKLVQDGKPITTNPLQEFIFIYDSNGVLYGTPATRKIKHTSLSRARPVQTAGSLEIDNGEIKKIGLDSGHYFPTLQSIYSLLALMHMNDVRLNEEIPVLYHDNFQKYMTTLKGLARC